MFDLIHGLCGSTYTYYNVKVVSRTRVVYFDVAITYDAHVFHGGGKCDDRGNEKMVYTHQPLIIKV